MVRYDQATRVEKQFVGSSEVTETLIQTTDFVRGRWFVVDLTAGPTTASNLELYVQSTAGSLAGSDGLIYRKMADSEFTYSASTGLVSLAKKATTKLVAAYSNYVGTPSPAITIGGTYCAVLYDPDNAVAAIALAADTLALGRYAVSGSEGGDAYVRDLSTGLVDPKYSVTVDPSGYAEVIYDGNVGAQTQAYRQPFVADMDWLYNTVLTGDKLDKTYAPACSKVIVLRLYSLSSKISVDTDVIEGSVEVYRNGVPDYAFTVDAASGTLTLGVAPGLDEEIRISYLRESSERSSGSLAAGLGGFFDLGGGLSAWTALGLRWSVPGTSYASSGQTDPGKVVLTAGERQAEGKLTHSLALAAQWSTAEASGRYRIDGMESTSAYHLSYRPLSGASSFDAIEVKESRLGNEWPDLESSLHSDGSIQKALGMTATDTGPVDLVLAKYIDAPPVADLRVFSFMARAGSDPSLYTSVLTVAIDAGTQGQATSELYISIPATELSTSWKRIVLRYGYGSMAVYIQDEEGGEPEDHRGGHRREATIPA